MTQHHPEQAPGLAPPDGAPELYEQDGLGMQAIVHAHYFIGGCDWLLTEYEPEDRLAFGWVCLNGDRQNAELGYFSLTELEEVRAALTIRSEDLDRTVTLPHAVAVERDQDWPPGLTLTQGIALLDERQGRS